MIVLDFHVLQFYLQALHATTGEDMSDMSICWPAIGQLPPILGSHWSILKLLSMSSWEVRT